MVSKDPATNKYLTEHGDGHLTSDHHVIGDIFLYVARRELRPIWKRHCPACLTRDCWRSEQTRLFPWGESGDDGQTSSARLA
eukprot:scaffold11666_cov58-Cyclotella_meneghiniana.AAC.1